MRHFIDPRFQRAAIGFDRMLTVIDAALNSDSGNFPPYDIEKTGDDAFRITLALAGYSQDELEIVTEDGALSVKGTKAKEPEEKEYLHRGIANRSFVRKFHLAEHVEVKAAALENGLLAIDLVREVPEAKKPRKVDINASAA